MIYNGVISESALCEGHHSLCNAKVSTTYDEKAYGKVSTINRFVCYNILY